MYNQKQFTKNITKFRKQRGLTQSELAEKLFVSAQSVSKWETGNSMPDMDNLCSLCKILSVSADELLGLNCTQSNNKVLIGIDGGGTKTEFISFDEKGQIIKRLLLDGTNPNSVGIEKACSTLKIGIDTLISDKTIGIFAGIAGCGSDQNRNAIVKFLNKNYPNIKIQCTTDILNVIGSVPNVTDCVAAICGTGSVVYGCCNQNKTLQRFGGWGYLLDGAGSGFDIGAAAVKTALAERDGVCPHSIITAMVEQKLGSTVWEKINEIYQQPPSFLASFAPIVFEAAKQNDCNAIKILNTTAERLVKLIKIANANTAKNNTLVISGSLISKETALTDLLQEQLGNNWQIIVPDMPQIFGACIQCCKMCDIDIHSVAETLMKEYKKGVTK